MSTYINSILEQYKNDIDNVIDAYHSKSNQVFELFKNRTTKWADHELKMSINKHLLAATQKFHPGKYGFYDGIYCKESIGEICFRGGNSDHNIIKVNKRIVDVIINHLLNNEDRKAMKKIKFVDPVGYYRSKNKTDLSRDNYYCAVMPSTKNVFIKRKRTSKFLGCSWNSTKGRWQVVLNYAGKIKNHGSFDDELDAARKAMSVLNGYYDDEDKMNLLSAIKFYDEGKLIPSFVTFVSFYEMAKFLRPNFYTDEIFKRAASKK